MKKSIFITWTKYTKRADFLSRNAFFCENINIFSKSSLAKIKLLKPIFYIKYFFETIFIIYKKRPDLIFTQCGPIFCPLAVYLYSRIFKCQYVIDAHTRTWTSFSNDLFLQKIIFKNAKLILIHNHESEKISKNFDNKFVLYDYPKISNNTFIRSNKKNFKFVFVPSHLDDNQKIITNLIAALPSNCSLTITGNLILANNNPNVKFVGFLNDDDYAELLSSSHFSIVILTRKDSDYVQSCRTVESISYDLPLIHTDSKAVREITPCGGGVFVSSIQPDLLRNSFLQAINSYDSLSKSISESRLQLESLWLKQYAQIYEKLDYNEYIIKCNTYQ